MEEIDKRIVEVARSAVKEYLESLMNTERCVFIEEHGGLRNGFYERKVKTKFGEIEDLSVPRDREGRFRSAALEPYSRSIGLDELIISLYSKFELERDPRYWRRYSRIDTQDPPSPG